jgi:hypothetical protein
LEGDLYGSGHSQPKKGMIWVFLSVLDFLGYRSSLQIMEETRKHLKNDWFSFFYGCLDCPIFYAFKKYITYLYPAHNNANNVLMVYWWEDFTRKSTHSHP